MHRYYDSMCDDCGDFNYAKREQTADLERPLCAGHRRPGQDRLSGIPQTAAGRRACHRHHAISRRRGRPLLEGAGFRGLSRAPADPRPRSAAYAERRVICAVPGRAAAAARLHSEQRLPDRAPAGGFLPASACRRGRIHRRASRGTGAARSRVTMNCGGTLQGSRSASAATPGSLIAAGARTGHGEGCCTARRSRSGAIWMKTFAAARRCFPPNRYDEDQAAGRSARDQ